MERLREEMQRSSGYPHAGANTRGCVREFAKLQYKHPIKGRSEPRLALRAGLRFFIAFLEKLTIRDIPNGVHPYNTLSVQDAENRNGLYPACANVGISQKIVTVETLMTGSATGCGRADVVNAKSRHLRICLHTRHELCLRQNRYNTDSR
jgi:hypothetical protein